MYFPRFENIFFTRELKRLSQNQNQYLGIVLIGMLFLMPCHLQAQTYDDYFGNGHNAGVTVTTSNESQVKPGAHTLSGGGMFEDEYLSSRFLAQSTLGYNYEDIQSLANLGVKGWLNQQFAITPIPYLDTYNEIYQEALALAPNSTFQFNYFKYAFYERIFETEDKLRQKVTFALGQILVVAKNIPILLSQGHNCAAYYDVLYDGAFGNFRDILFNVAMNPAMGNYLSHYENRKADFQLGTLPDENFAREIMQLFSIGLHELNNNGTYKIDGNGELIPTYDIVDVQELSKVFTGLSGAARNDGASMSFGTGVEHVNLRLPMLMYQEYHSPGSKTMIDGSVIPAGQSGMADINDAIDVLFNHPNVGPFIGLRLIQQLVKSNPTPQYINRVATVFNNNGEGIRGDMKAVISAILTDPEARDSEWIDNVHTGKLRQPQERITQLFTAFDISTPSGKYYIRDVHSDGERIQQPFFDSPSVFNFFSPNYAEKDFIAPLDLVSPEFQILNATSAMHYINLLEETIKTIPFYNYTAGDASGSTTIINTNDNPYFDFQDEINAYNNNGMVGLLDRLDLILCHGQLSNPVRNIITQTINQNLANLSDYSTDDLVRDAIYYIMITPDYILLR